VRADSGFCSTRLMQEITSQAQSLSREIAFIIKWNPRRSPVEAMNLLRLIGQNTLNEPDAPMRHTAKRRRIKTVMQEMMFKAGRMIKHAGRWILGLGEADSGFAVFERHYGQLRAA
jgi:hypothetical protein